MEWPVAAIFLWHLPRRLFPNVRNAMEPQRSGRHLGNIGELIIVEGEVVRVDCAGWGKSKRSRYVIHAADAVVVYEGPALMAGRRELIRFTATIRSHRHTGQIETVVYNARDVVIIQRPSGSYGKRSRQAGLFDSRGFSKG